MIPIAKMSYTSTVADTQRVRYRCEACGIESGVVVSAVSQGYTEAVYFVGMKQAECDAADQAVAGLPAALKKSVGLAGCPKCGARDRHVRRRAILDAMVRGAFGPAIWLTVPLILVVIAGFGYAFDEQTLRAFGFAAGCVAALALVVGIATRISYTRLAREANTLVVWDDEAAPLG
jgi:hypothetical protein